jgi:hypothetical protein
MLEKENLAFDMNARSFSSNIIIITYFTPKSNGKASHYKHVKMEGPARTDSGLVVLAPQFISPGNWIRVNTVNGDYMERVSGTR